MTQDEKLIWAATYASMMTDGNMPTYMAHQDVALCVNEAYYAVLRLRQFAEKTGSVHRDETLAKETKYTTAIEGIEL